MSAREVRLSVSSSVHGACGRADEFALCRQLMKAPTWALGQQKARSNVLEAAHNQQLVNEDVESDRGF